MEFTPAPYSPPPSPTADDIQNFEPDPPGLPLPSPGPPEDIPEQPHTPLQPLDRAETPPNPPPTQNCARRIAYDRRLPPAIDIDELSRVTVIPKLRHNMEYVSLLRNASLEDPIAKMTPAQLNRLRNPPPCLGLLRMDGSWIGWRVRHTPNGGVSISTQISIGRARKKRSY